AWARHEDRIGEKIDRIQVNDYAGLLLLEQLFLDKEELTSLLRPRLEKWRSANVNAWPRRPLSLQTPANPGALARQLSGVWKSVREDKLKRLEIILQGLDPAAIEADVLPKLYGSSL